MTDRDPATQALCAALAAPFEPREIKFKPQMVKNNRALAMPYIDARLIQDRLDEVLGIENWQDKYDLLPDGSVMCRLRVRLGDRWVTKADVGSPSEQPDCGDRLKAAFSDALKRAAVKFGIGRYLYRIQAQWVDYDPVKKQLTQLPQLPAFALPKPKGQTQPQPKPEAKSPPPPPPPPPPAAAAQPEPAKPGLPANGFELSVRVHKYDAALTEQKLCVRGSLLAHVVAAGVKAGYAPDVTKWSGPAIAFAAETVKQFEATLRKTNGKPPAGGKTQQLFETPPKEIPH